MTVKTLAVYLGRFSPFHLGHVKVLRRALSLYDNVLVIIGSADQPRTIRDPWTFNERKDVISEWWADYSQKTDDGRLFIRSALDFPYNDAVWLAEVNKTIGVVEEQLSDRGQSSVKTYLTGSDRDDSTYYLKLFPNLKKDLIEQDTAANLSLSSTIVRDLYFGRTFDGRSVSEESKDMLLKSFLPPEAREFLSRFVDTEEHAALLVEYKFIKKYQEQWKVAPYPPTFCTVDAVVVQAGHVLLIQRKAAPGKGLWALPGGFLNQNETFLTGAIRELKEETKIKLSPMQLRGSVKKKEVFDKPDRSLRGRTISVGFLLELNETGELPAVKANSDAGDVRWTPLAEVRRDEMFEDHFHIIETMIGGLI